MHTAFIYARRIAAAALIAAAAVTPAAAWDYSDTSRPAPRPSYIGAQSDKSPTITAAQYHRELDRLSDTMANVQRGHAAGTISQKAFEAAQIRHGRAIRALQARLSSGGLSYGVGGNSSDPNDCRQRCN